jgi:hypothetical protein
MHGGEAAGVFCCKRLTRVMCYVGCVTWHFPVRWQPAMLSMLWFGAAPVLSLALGVACAMALLQSEGVIHGGEADEQFICPCQVLLCYVTLPERGTIHTPTYTQRA